MHVAICDDNVGDRKQLERLLKRESDLRAKTTGVLYIDSFGNAGALLQSPILYDAYFIDMVSDGQNGAALALKLIEGGTASPIVLCSSLIPYEKEISSCGKEIKNPLLYLDKPIIKAELSKAIDFLAEKKSSSLPRIELREEKETRYVTEDEIVHAHANGIYVTVHLNNGDSVNILSSVDNFFAEIGEFEHYYALTNNSMVNINYVKKVTLFKIHLLDGTELKISPSYASDLKKNMNR